MKSNPKKGNSKDELQRQDNFPWQRGGYYSSYEKILGKHIVQSVFDNMRPSSLLDLACGNGDLTSMMAPHFNRIVGLDASRKLIETAQALHGDIEFVHSLAEEYFDEEGFDTITLITLLEHVQDPVELLRLCSRNLKPNGVIIAHVPNALAVNRRIARIMGSLADEYELSPFDRNVVGHRRSYDMGSLVKELESAGLSVIKTGGVFYKMLSTPQINWLLEKGPWEEGGFGWGRVGEKKDRDWRLAFCEACYEFGKERPGDCNVIYAVGKRKE